VLKHACKDIDDCTTEKIMTDEKDPKQSPPIHETIAVIKKVSQYKPLGPADHRSGLESFAEAYSNWAMVLAGLCFLPPVLLAFVFDPANASNANKSYALACLTASVLLALVSMIIPILATASVLVRWKTMTLDNLESDIRHEHGLTVELKKHGADALQEAKMWLELKIKRLDGRIAWFFGDKAAVLTLIASAYIFSKEFGGFGWLKETLLAGATTGNAGNMTLLYIGALVFGLSIGAILVKHLSAKYRFQVELIDIALRYLPSASL
jgi:hypothetical protein